MSAGECRKKLTILSKNAEGRTGAAQVSRMECQGQASDKFCCLVLEMRLSPGPCEDANSKITAQLDGELHGTLEVIRDHRNARGCFAGRWQLIHGQTVLAAGELSGTVGAGTHRVPGVPQECEKCAVPDHYEGKMTGQVLIPGEFLGAEICATVAGTGPLAPTHSQRMAIEGVLISCCPD